MCVWGGNGERKSSDPLDGSLKKTKPKQIEKEQEKRDMVRANGNKDGARRRSGYVYFYQNLNWNLRTAAS